MRPKGKDRPRERAGDVEWAVSIRDELGGETEVLDSQAWRDFGLRDVLLGEAGRGRVVAG